MFGMEVLVIQSISLGQLDPDISSLKILDLVHVLLIDKKALLSHFISSGFSVEHLRTPGKNDH